MIELKKHFSLILILLLFTYKKKLFDTLNIFPRQKVSLFNPNSEHSTECHSKNSTQQLISISRNECELICFFHQQFQKCNNIHQECCDFDCNLFAQKNFSNSKNSFINLNKIKSDSNSHAQSYLQNF